MQLIVKHTYILCVLSPTCINYYSIMCAMVAYGVCTYVATLHISVKLHMYYTNSFSSRQQVPNMYQSAFANSKN